MRCSRRFRPFTCIDLGHKYLIIMQFLRGAFLCVFVYVEKFYSGTVYTLIPTGGSKVILNLYVCTNAGKGNKWDIWQRKLVAGIEFELNPN